MSERAIDLRSLRDPIVVMAFSGWNDAGSAATDTIAHLIERYPSEFIFSLDPDDYYDFQVNRPIVARPAPGEQTITWPTTQVQVCRHPKRDIVIVTGPEPNMRWRQFATSVISALRIADPDLVVMLGALLADSPHTRPIPITGTASSLELADVLGLELSTYEGPTGIVGIVADSCAMAGIAVVSLWAAVPHYVSQAPSPKATLALLSRLEDVLGVSIDLDELPELARAWERGVDELAAEDTEIAEYIQALEQQQDETDLPEASGDAIAAEFERYLRRRDI